MYTKEDLQRDIQRLGVLPTDTLLVHSSLKAVGSVEGGPDTVLDSFCEQLSQGLLVLPTHTWAQINAEYNVFDVQHEPSCVGTLTNIFRHRPGVVRSWHPTHSLAAWGRGAEEFAAGEEQFDTPCPRAGCYGKLYDRKAKVLFLGVPLTRNTLIHGVEEWAGVPNRIAPDYQYLKILTPDGRLLDRPMRRHRSPVHVSDNYDKLEEPLLALGIARRGRIGGAESILVEVAPMVEITMEFLKRNPDLFLDNKPVPREWYESYR